MSYSNSRTNAYLHIVTVVTSQGHSMYHAVKYAGQIDALMDEQLFILAAKSDDSIARSFRRWLKPVQLEEEAEQLRIIAAITGAE